MRNKNSINFTEGKILSPLLMFCLPIFAALFLQAMYGAVDLMVIGQFDDAAGVSGVGTGSAVMMLVTTIINGFAVGTTVMIGRRIGENAPEKAGKAIGASIFLFAILSVVLTVLMLVYAEPLARLMKAPEEAFDETVTYVRICSSGIIFITAYNVIGGIFRGLGNSTLPMIFVAIACVVNIIGDLLFVAVFKMNVAGAALATIMAQMVSVILSLVIIRRQNLPFKFTLKDIGFHKEELKTIIKIGSPISFQDALTHFSFLMINAITNNIGLAESAGYGVAERVTGFIFLVPSAVMSGITAFVAQNYGAGKLDRARKGMKTGIFAGSIGGLVLFLLGFFFAEPLSSIFANDPAVIEQAALYLKGFSSDCLLTCTLFSFIGYFNGCGETTCVMLQGITASFLFRVPLSWLLANIEGASLMTIGFAAPLATVYGIIFCIIAYIFIAKKQNKLMN